MENNEIMNYEANDVMNDDVVAEGGSSVVETIVKMAIGAGIAAAGFAVGKLAKGAVGKWKSKKELRQPDKEIIVEAEQVEKVAEPEGESGAK